LKKIDDKLFDAAWNMLLLDIPPQRINLLEALATRYKLFLLSNTNLIHYKSFATYIQQKFKNRKLEDYFEKTYLSFNMGFRKPDQAIYKAMIEDSWMVPAKSLFIDDTEANIKAAAALGIHGHHLKPGESITMIFDKDLNYIGKRGK
jgi:glucose-1-phosphatase